MLSGKSVYVDQGASGSGVASKLKRSTDGVGDALLSAKQLLDRY